MSDPPKSNSPFSFAQPNTSGSSGGLFGQGASNNPKPAGSLFGSNSPASSAANPFSNTSTTGGNSSVFGSNVGGNGGNNLFGGASKQSSGWTFGQPQSNTPIAGSLGSGQSEIENKQPSITASSSTNLFSTPNKPSEQPATTQSQTSNIFGGGASTGGSFNFGNAGSNTSIAGQAASTTPTSKPNSNIFGNSTTPAGPPPMTISSASSGSVLFGKPPQDTANPFASLGQIPSTQQPTTSTAAPSGGFNGFSLGASKPQETPAPTSSAQPASIFSSSTNAGGSNVFGNKRGAECAGNLFGNINKNQDTGASKGSGSQQFQNEPAKNSNMFNLGAQSPANISAPQTTSASLIGDTAPKAPFSFAKATQEQPSAINPVASPAATPNGLNLFDKPASSGTSAPSASASSGGLGDMFANIGKPQDKAAATNVQSAGASAPALMAPPATSNAFGGMGKAAASTTSNLFGDTGKPATQPANSQAPAQPGTAQLIGGAAANLGASMAGPAPTAQSRLKNKSMDEIITRWASDLSKYQKEFQQQAERVATWDRMLVDNSNNIQKLYGATLEAERATTEVERQLTVVENDQEELSMWLDHYEKEVDTMIFNSVGQGDSLSGPDQERERT